MEALRGRRWACRANPVHLVLVSAIILPMIADKKKHAAEIAKRLKKLYPEPIVELDYTTPCELMVASLLAAQNRDTTINKITPALFRKYCGPADYLAVDSAELEQDIHLSGFFRQKTIKSSRP